MSKLFLTALALMLVLEGVVPFLFPDKWRQAFLRITALNDGQIRFFGLTSMVLGLILLTIFA